jgi:hypothetical protein
MRPIVQPVIHIHIYRYIGSQNGRFYECLYSVVRTPWRPSLRIETGGARFGGRQGVASSAGWEWFRRLLVLAGSERQGGDWFCREGEFVACGCHTIR